MVIDGSVSATSFFFKRKWRHLTTLTQKLLTAITRDTYNEIEYCDALLVCQDTDRGYVFQGKAYAQIVDSLSDRLRQSGIATQSIVGNFSRISGTAAYGAPVTMNRFLLQNVLFSRLKNIVNGRAVGESWGQNNRTDHWRKILKKCKAKVVFAIQPEIALCRAGHELAVQIFDVQHGIISDSVDNPYYRTENLLDKELTDIPHGFLCWDDSSAAVLRPLASRKGYGVYVIGNPWFARFVAPNDDDALVRDELSLGFVRKRAIPAILVTLQFNLSECAKDYVENGVMATCLEQTIRETCHKYFWHIRLHPSQIRSMDSVNTEHYLRSAFRNLPNIDWDIASRLALPALLATVDLHITHFSAVTVEATWFGVRTGLLDPHIQTGRKHSNLFILEREQGYAKLIPLESNKIKEFILSVIDEKKSVKKIPKQCELNKIMISSLFNN
jgi:hypothetical protein